jgi:hypothetical protein
MSLCGATHLPLDLHWTLMLKRIAAGQHRAQPAAVPAPWGFWT